MQWMTLKRQLVHVTLLSSSSCAQIMNTEQTQQSNKFSSFHLSAKLLNKLHAYDLTSHHECYTTRSNTPYLRFILQSRRIRSCSDLNRQHVIIHLQHGDRFFVPVVSCSWSPIACTSRSSFAINILTHDRIHINWKSDNILAIWATL